ncbi:hypothetical protein V6N13_064355 [Hibiscus sabdariffa]
MIQGSCEAISVYLHYCSNKGSLHAITIEDDVEAGVEDEDEVEARVEDVDEVEVGDIAEDSLEDVVEDGVEAEDVAEDGAETEDAADAIEEEAYVEVEVEVETDNDEIPDVDSDFFESDEDIAEDEVYEDNVAKRVA